MTIRSTLAKIVTYKQSHTRILKMDTIIDAIIDSYEGDDIWAYEDEVRTTIKDCDGEDGK